MNGKIIGYVLTALVIAALFAMFASVDQHLNHPAVRAAADEGSGPELKITDVTEPVTNYDGAVAGSLWVTYELRHPGSIGTFELEVFDWQGNELAIVPLTPLKTDRIVWAGRGTIVPRPESVVLWVKSLDGKRSNEVVWGAPSSAIYFASEVPHITGLDPERVKPWPVDGDGSRQVRILGKGFRDGDGIYARLDFAAELVAVDTTFVSDTELIATLKRWQLGARTIGDGRWTVRLVAKTKEGVEYVATN